MINRKRLIWLIIVIVGFSSLFALNGYLWPFVDTRLGEWRWLLSFLSTLAEIGLVAAIVAQTQEIIDWLKGKCNE